MKNFTLLLLAIVFGVGTSSFAQTKSLKGSGETFYKTTFDWGNPADEKGWTAPEGFYMEDPDDIGYNFHWYPNDSLISQWTREVPWQSSSKEDGHLALFLGQYTGYLDNYFDVNNSVVFPTFDCSDKSSVVVRYETSFMCYSSGWSMHVLVSNDAGVHWAAYDAGFNCGHKDRPDDISSGQVAVFEANISEVAAGVPEVIIKLFWGATSDYFWLIDDFELAEAYDNDLRMEHYVLEFDDGDENTIESYFHSIPISQVGGSFTNFESSVYNFGEEDQWGTLLEVDITKNNQSIWNYTSESTLMSTLFRDTMRINEAFTPTEFGHYKLTYDFKQEAEEQTPEDDMAEVFFDVTDSVYSRADNTSEEAYCYGFEAYGAEGVPNEQHFVGSQLPIYGDCEVEGVAVYVAGGLADGQIEFRGALYWVPPADEDPDGLGAIQWLLSDMVVLDSSMHNTWVYFPFEKDGESEFLFDGDNVYAGVEYWNWHTEVVPYKRYENFKIGSDVGVQLRDPVSIVRGGAEASWDDGTTVTKRKFMVKLYLNDHSNKTDGVNLMKNLTVLSQNYPNPFVGSTEISYDLAQSNDVLVELTDMTGRVVMSIDEGTQAAGSHSVTIHAESLDAGVYFYTLKAGQFTQTKRMVIN